MQGSLNRFISDKQFLKNLQEKKKNYKQKLKLLEKLFTKNKKNLMILFFH